MFDRELNYELDKKFEKDVVCSLIKIANDYGFIGDNNSLRERIKYLTSYFFSCGCHNEDDYIMALFGAICPNSAFLDFKHYVNIEIPSISNYYEARQGLDNFVGKYVITKKNHSASKKIIPGTIVKIIGISERGYDIMSENGDKVLEIGFTI